MNKGKIWIGLSVTAVFTAAAAAAGMYLGSMIYRTWIGLKTEPSVGMLWKYWQHIDRLPENMVFPLKAASVVAGLVPLLALAVILFTLFSKPKKELHGSSRFANLREIKKMGLLWSGGSRWWKFWENKKKYPDLILGKVNGEYLRWSSDSPVYLAARPRSGKGVGFVVPNCLHYNGSMVVNDVKKELFFITAGFRAAHGHEVYFFNPSGTMPEHTRNPYAPLVSHRWNPLTYIRRDPKHTAKDTMNVAAIFYPLPANEQGDGSHGFFQKAARKLFTGLVLYMIETERKRDLKLPENKTTLGNLFRMTVPKDGSTLVDWIKKEVELRDMQPHTRLSNDCKTLLLDFANSEGKVAASILSTMTGPLDIFLFPTVDAATSGDDFYLDEVRSKRMTIYLGVSPEELKIYSTLMNLFFSQLVDVNLRQGLASFNPRQFKYQCLLMLDEFTSLGRIRAIEEGVAYLAGYGLRPVLVFQSPSQLKSVYGEAVSNTFFSSFAAQIVFTPREQKDAKELSELIGHYTYKAESKSRSRGKSSSRSQSISDQKREVMNADELKLMPRSDCIISMEGQHAIYGEKITYYNDPIFSKRADWPIPEIPELIIQNNQPQPQQLPYASAAKPEYLDPEKLDGFAWQDAANAEEIAKTLITALVPPGSKPEYVAELVPAIARNWGDDSLPVIAAILKNIGASDAKLPDAA